MRENKVTNVSGKSDDSVEYASKEDDDEGVCLCVCTISTKCKHLQAVKLLESSLCVLCSYLHIFSFDHSQYM
jgi:predicted peroxiredoxin